MSGMALGGGAPVPPASAYPAAASYPPSNGSGAGAPGAQPVVVVGYEGTHGAS
ncbi:hypothetical protein MNEG_10922, partial [Monoraphidium neglectum]